MESNTFVRWFEDLTSDDVGEVGGKNASLGEMIQSLKAEGVRVPDGFATTAEAYWKFLQTGDLKDQIRDRLQELESGCSRNYFNVSSNYYFFNNTFARL